MPNNDFVTRPILQQELKKVENKIDDGFRKIDRRFRSLDNKLIKKLNIIIEGFDRPILDHEKRIVKIEDHLGFPGTTSQI